MSDAGPSLRQLAVAARSEIWEHARDEKESDYGEWTSYHSVRQRPGRWGSGEVAEIHHEEDARFIAAASPAVVLSLLNDIDLLRERLSPPLFAEYAASREQLEEQRLINVALEAENDELARENSRLLSIMQQILRGYEECSKFVEKAKERVS